MSCMMTAAEVSFAIMPAHHLQQDVIRYTGLIEAELRRIGYWQNHRKLPGLPKSPELMNVFNRNILAILAIPAILAISRGSPVGDTASADNFLIAGFSNWVFLGRSVLCLRPWSEIDSGDCDFSNQRQDEGTWGDDRSNRKEGIRGEFLGSS